MPLFLSALPRSTMVVICLSAFGLAACGPLEIYHKAGAQVSTMNRTLTECEVGSLSRVPVDRRVERDPIRIVPRRICDSQGNCTIVHDRVGGEVRTYDNNAGLRQRVLNQCMEDQGYRYVAVPACPSAIKRAAPAGASTILPQLGANSCSIRNNDGTWQIVTQG